MQFLDEESCRNAELAYSKYKRIRLFKAIQFDRNLPKRISNSAMDFATMKFVFRVSAILSLSLGAALASQASAATNLLVNGSFDSANLGSMNYYNIGANGDHASLGGFGWTVTTNNVDIQTYAGIYGGSTPSSSSGAQFLDLVGYGSTGGISQTFATQKGATYSVSFEYSNNPYSTSDASAAVQVTGASSLLDADVEHKGAIKQGNLGWTTYQGVFTADSSKATLSLTEILGANCGGVYLDDISVVETAAPPSTPSGPSGPVSGAPEPSTWGMMILGFVGLGLVRRRQSAVATV